MTTSVSSNLNPYNRETVVGQCARVNASTLYVSLGGPHAKVTPQIGQYLISANDGKAVCGPLREVSQTQNGLMGVVELQATFVDASLRFVAGVLTSPPPGAAVFRISNELLTLLLENRGIDEACPEVVFDMLTVPEIGHTPIAITPEKLFGRHLAILGASGGGKSWTVARVMEECTKFRSKVLLLDATGEYSTLEHGVQHVHIGHDPDARPDSLQVSVPFSQLRENDLFAIFKPSGQSQSPKLRAAMKSLKLARLAPYLAPSGMILKAHKEKLPFMEAYSQFYELVESNEALFNIHNLSAQLQNECVAPHRSPTEPNIWGGPTIDELSSITPLANRVQDVITNPSLACIFQPGEEPSLFEVLDTFIERDSLRVLRVSLKYLPFAHNAREIVANAIGRRIMELSRQDVFRNSPMVTIVDEAHQFLAKITNQEGEEYPMDSFSLIAKEGRKYASTIALATQRPRDIPTGVLSQMGTMIVHRLTNNHDRSVVERACAEMDKSATQKIPVLSAGQAVIIGVDFPIPLHIKINAPENPPHSSSADYQKFWTTNVEPEPVEEPKRQIDLAALSGRG